MKLNYRLLGLTVLMVIGITLMLTHRDESLPHVGVLPTPRISQPPSKPPASVQAIPSVALPVEGNKQAVEEEVAPIDEGPEMLETPFGTRPSRPF